MDMRFRRVCEEAAAAWSVPALAAGMDAGGGAETFAVGCETDTRFRIASVTKPMVAALVLSLLDVEEETGVWPPDVRVRHLLSHTSGFDCELPGDVDQLAFGDGDDALARCVAELPGVPRPLAAGELWSYANTGFWLAGWLAAERAGATFEEALTQSVLVPAGMAASSFSEPDLAGTGPDALPGPYPRARRPSGGIVSTAEDVLRFGRRLLADSASARMRAVHGKPVGGVYGLGLFGERVAGVEVWGHGGSWGGFQSSFLVVPERGAVFAGLTNASRGGKALRLVEDEFFRLVLGEPRREPRFVSLPAPAYEAFAGTYDNGEGRYEVRVAPDGLLLAEDGGEYLGRAVGERTFQIVNGDRIGDRFDFPRAGLGRFGGRVAQRVG